MLVQKTATVMISYSAGFMAAATLLRILMGILCQLVMVTFTGGNDIYGGAWVWS